MRALTLLALVSLTACEQATEPRLAPPDGPAYDVVYSPNETATLEIEAAAHSLYDFNNCLAFVYPYYTANPNCLFTDITPDVASDANFPITYLYLMNDPPPAEQIPEIMISPTEAIAKLEEYKAIILDGYNDGFVSCRARFATHNIADEIIAGIGRLTPTITSVEIPQWILDGVFDTGVDPFADATTPEGAPCGPPPPPPPSPDPGAVLYSMWASNTSCKGTSSLHVSGSHGFFAGTVHTNGEIKITGSMHEFAGVVNFVCGSPPARKHVWYRPDSEQVPPAAPPAKYARAGFTCTTTVNGNLKL